MTLTIMAKRIVVLASLLLLIPAGGAQAQGPVTCVTGDVITSPPTYSDVMVGKGVICMLDGAALHGSVFVQGGRLTIRDSDILGGVFVNDTNAVTRLLRTTVYGDLSLNEAGPVNIDAGELADVAVNHSRGTVDIRNSAVDGVLKVENGRGDVMVSDVAGSGTSDLVVMERSGTVEVVDSSVGDVKIEGTGKSVVLEGVFVDGDITVADSGRVAMRRSESGRPSALDGDVDISDAQGKIGIFDVTTSGDITISDSGAVAFRRNDASNEDVRLNGNSGPVLVEGNIRLGLSLGGNGQVGIYGNDFTDAEISHNTGSIEFAGNAGASLSCEDNLTTPEDLGGNTIAESSQGQCEGI